MHKQSLALKFSFVFVILSMAISLLTAAWQLAQGKSGSLLLVLETGAGLLLVLLPALLSKWLRFYLPAFCACTGWPLPSSAGSFGNAMSLPVTVFSP